MCGAMDGMFFDQSTNFYVFIVIGKKIKAYIFFSKEIIYLIKIRL